MTLRDPEGELLLAGFQGQGFTPMDRDDAMFFAPLSFALVDAPCPAPCEGLGCFTRAALDVTLATQTTRILDGNAATLGESPSYHVHVGAAMTGSGAPDDPRRAPRRRDRATAVSRRAGPSHTRALRSRNRGGPVGDRAHRRR